MLTYNVWMSLLAIDAKGFVSTSIASLAISMPSD